MAHAHEWLNYTEGAQPTSTVSLLRRGKIVASRTWNESWTGMAAHGGLLALYRGPKELSRSHHAPPHYEVCRVGPDYQMTTVWSYEDYPPTINGDFGEDIDTPTGTLFCQLHKYGVLEDWAEVRSLTETGFVRTATIGPLSQITPDLAPHGVGASYHGRPWHAIVPC